ncbi:hypothetical protein NBRC116601_16780 [Cognatishimia sp. WU-CL00825]|uniref:hypothetical protein n=1 Tax=Cognatishimia sp. WU-CL00825 TaxID=3127658 RepID=UPI003108B789
MRIFAFVACLALAGFSAWYFLYRDTAPTDQDLTQIMRSAVPGLLEADLTVQDCQLSISVAQLNADQTHFTQALLRADLSLFDFSEIRILPTKKDQAILIIQRSPMTLPMVHQAERLLSEVPSQFTQKAGTLVLRDGKGNQVTTQLDTQENIRNLLRDPTRSLTISLASTRIGSTQEETPALSPHADAPAFFDYSERLVDLSQPMTFHMTRFFEGKTARRDTLLSAAVSMPEKLQFQVLSQDVAEALAETLYRYTNGHCRG